MEYLEYSLTFIVYAPDKKVHNSEKKLQEHISEFHRMLVDSYITTRNILGDC